LERRFISQPEFDEAEFALASNQHSYTALLAPQDGVVTELRAEAASSGNFPTRPGSSPSRQAVGAVVQATVATHYRRLGLKT
jgi:hypothetical protein